MEQNKNKTFLLIFGLLLMLSLAFTFSGCVPPVPEIIEVTGVSITEEDQSMKVDETLQLTAVVTPEDADNKAITWESDNPDVATVDEDGLVTALSAGTANITVTTEDGTFTDTIKITVTKPYTPSAPAPTVKKYKVSFQVIDGIPAEINSRNGVSIDLSGFKIEIFTDAERNTKKTETETENDGTASVKLPNGEYWFRVSKEGYADYPPENNDLSVQRTPNPDPGYFVVDGADVTESIQVPMEPLHTVTFVVTDQADSSPIQDAKISVFSDSEKVIPVGSIQTTDANGEATLDVELPSGTTYYYYTVAADGYQDYECSFDASNETVKIEMLQVYNVTIADLVGGTATVVANPNTDILEGDPVTVTISNIESGKTFSLIVVTGDDTSGSITTTEVTAGEEYTFTMPAEDVTVTVTVEDDVCPEAGYIYNGSAYDDNWMTGITTSLGTLTEQSLETDHQRLYAKSTSGTSVNIDISYSTVNPIDLTCINSIIIDWENTGSDSDSNRSHLVVASYRNTRYSESTTRFSKQNSFIRKTNELDKLDVSDLTGSYYIRVHASADAGSNCESEVNVYSIELSEDMVVPE